MVQMVKTTIDDHKEKTSGLILKLKASFMTSDKEEILMSHPKIEAIESQRKLL